MKNITTTNYMIHKDLSNKNRIRLDLLNGAKISDVKELRAYRITIEENFQDGLTNKFYLTLEEYSEIETIINSKTIELENALDKIGVDYELSPFGEDGNIISLEGDNHHIYINIDNEDYSLSTKHNDREVKMYEEEYKNNKTVKSVKAVITYLNKFL